MSDPFKRYEELDALLAEALDLDPVDRSEFLERISSTGGDQREALERLLAETESAELLKPGDGLADALAVLAESPPAVEPTLAPGTRIGSYEIDCALGVGGMGQVYQARDTRLGRDVAIKVLPRDLAQNEQLRARLEREAQAIARLNHPHICVLYNTGSEDGVDFLVMELLEGRSLRELLAQQRLSFDQALELAEHIASALDAAHRKGIVHRDLKPENVFVTASGAKLFDFGLARFDGVAIGDSDTRVLTLGATLTTEGAILGTLQYMAPEQLEGKSVDSRTEFSPLAVFSSKC